MDGLKTGILFPASFADITVSGYVIGGHPAEEYEEMVRVTKPGGTVVLCPGNSDKDNNVHQLLVSQGFQGARLKEPADGVRRKYWKTV